MLHLSDMIKSFHTALEGENLVWSTLTFWFIIGYPKRPSPSENLVQNDGKGVDVPLLWTPNVRIGIPKDLRSPPEKICEQLYSLSNLELITRKRGPNLKNSICTTPKLSWESGGYARSFTVRIFKLAPFYTYFCNIDARQYSRSLPNVSSRTDQNRWLARPNGLSPRNSRILSFRDTPTSSCEDTTSPVRVWDVTNRSSVN